jgi:hypothetical protein
MAKAGVRNRTAEFLDSWELIRAHCEQACVRSHLQAFEAPSLAYCARMGCLGAFDFADEQRCVCTSRWSANFQLSDRSRGFALRGVVHVRHVSGNEYTVLLSYMMVLTSS